MVMDATSPVNAQQDTSQGRSLATSQLQTSLSTEFQRVCLTEVTANAITDISTQTQELVAKVEGSTTQDQGYEHSNELLNKIVKELKKHYGDLDEYQDENLVLFIPKPKNPLPHHPRGYLVRPDILALSKSTEKRLTKTPGWHYLRSVGEWKPRKNFLNNDVEQQREFIASAIQARPDNPSMLGVIMSPGGYMLSYGSPCGYVVTEHLTFSNIAPLVSYVHSLHVLPAAIDLADPKRTITLHTGDDPDSTPRWRITDDIYGLKNHLFDLIFIGPPFSRMTTVFADPEGDLVVKDSYLQDHRQCEAELFKEFGEDFPAQWVPVVVPTDTAVKFNPLEKMSFGSEFAHRQRHRLVLRSTGLPFEKCETISEAVGAIYDLLESNRWAIVKCRVIHRDITGNIFIRPTPGFLPQPGPDDVCFIRGVYDRNPLRPSLAILFDLDNGVELKEKHLTLKEIDNDNSLPSTTRDLKALTGTPLYIARGPSLGVYVPPARPYMFEPLPQLQPPDAAERYEKAYPNDPFRKKQGKIGEYNEDLSNECFEEQPHTMQLIQRPWHDAESLMLMFLIFLLRSKPKDSEPEGVDKLMIMQEVYGLVRNTRIGTRTDHRGSYLIRGRWRQLLHARLAYLAKSITEMCQALNCDYEFLLPATGVDHEVVLHEILQRHLFQIYYKLNDPEEKEFQDVRLDTSSFRPYHKELEPRRGR
ncbi:hypothetical protein K435DRAFT_961716 [Dendrothele bispora CBS 962.96]|uniref:Fungal-type protein kinase domain-containing protein n=1 Tax=Dendrothele bispora (strain CBS 962.96) TaxID=1314807 RepID=A0A4V4HI07_DENBC|nr:hypothetical protein K435DRAFT_961716 [Dendrothele bispora CBS 962.96]